MICDGFPACARLQISEAVHQGQLHGERKSCKTVPLPAADTPKHCSLVRVNFKILLTKSFLRIAAGAALEQYLFVYLF